MTGHSLGAATATLLAPYIGFLINGKKPVPTLPSNITVFTSGTPAVGDTQFANFLNNQPNYQACFNENDAIPCLWSTSGQFSIPNMYNLFPPPEPNPMPDSPVKSLIEDIVRRMTDNMVSYQQSKAVTFTFETIPETGQDPWMEELMYQHNTAYDVYFGITSAASKTGAT